MSTREVSVYRLNENAQHHLWELSNANPELWLDPETDFESLLTSAGIGAYSEPIPNLTVKEDGLALMVPSDEGRRNTADRQAVSFHRAFTGLSPRGATDKGLWAWLNHFRLHSYSLRRWRQPAEKESLPRFIQDHWFAETSRAIWESNTASRTWWMGQIAIKAAIGSNGSFTSITAINHLAEHAEHYHMLLYRGAAFTWDEVVLGEFLRILLFEQGAITYKGVWQIWRSLNLLAGYCLLDDLPRKKIRQIIEDQTDQVMSVATYVKNRNRIRNRLTTTVLSLGAGVQSSALALMCEQNAFGLQRPDLAIFADTGWEPPAVYEHLEWLEKQLSYPVVKVSAGNIREDLLKGVDANGRPFLNLPVHFADEKGRQTGVGRRKCTEDYKIKPIREYLRNYLGIPKGQRAPKNIQVEQWLGISIEESQRQKPNPVEWITNKYPLVEKGFSRTQLHAWFKDRYPDRSLPKSSCIGCPYHGNSEWKEMKQNDVESWNDAVYIDNTLRNLPDIRNNLRGFAYLHRSRIPLQFAEVDDVSSYSESMAEECEGICGL